VIVALVQLSKTEFPRRGHGSATDIPTAVRSSQLSHSSKDSVLSVCPCPAELLPNQD